MNYSTTILFLLIPAIALSSCDLISGIGEEQKSSPATKEEKSFAVEPPQQQVEIILARTSPAPESTTSRKPSADSSQAADQQEAAEETKSGDTLVLGDKIYRANCALCHDQGIAGAPKLVSGKDWSSRLKKGKETLVKHALHGFQGEMGVMPPKGGNPKLSDEEVKAAVSYMLDAIENQ